MISLCNIYYLVIGGITLIKNPYSHYVYGFVIIKPIILLNTSQNIRGIRMLEMSRSEIVL